MTISKIQVEIVKGGFADANFVILNPLYPVDSSTLIFWMSSFVILGVSGLFCRFYSISDRKYCSKQ